MNHEAGEMHAIWRIKGFIKHVNDTLLGVWIEKWHIIRRIRIKKNFVGQDSVLKFNSRLSFYYCCPVAQMAWKKSWGCPTKTNILLKGKF